MSTARSRALEVADELGARSVAFPLISMGVYGWPRRDAIAAAVETIAAADTRVEEARLVAFDPESLREVRAQLASSTPIRIFQAVQVLHQRGYHRVRALPGLGGSGGASLWARTVSDQVKTRRPELPEGAKARTKERWLPLKRVAVAAGGRWPEVVDQLVLLDLERMKLDREEGILNEKPHVLLLRNISEVWLEGETFLSTDDIISMLVAKYPSAWGHSDRYPKGLTAQRIGRMLVKNFGVYSDRSGSTKIRGYTARSFDRALQSVRIPSLSEPAKLVKAVEPAEGWAS